MPWQVYMVPQFLMMRKMGIERYAAGHGRITGIFGIWRILMRQFIWNPGFPVRGGPDRRHERVQHLQQNHAAAVQTGAGYPLFTFVATWNDYLGPWTIYLKKRVEKNNPDWASAFYRAVFQRIWTDHGGVLSYP